MTTMRTGFLDHEGERLYWEEIGDPQAEPLVLCHGAGGNHAVWFQQVVHFASRYRVVTWDQRGFGRSSMDTGDLGPVPAVRDLRAVLDHLGIRRAHVVGQSMGGWPALGFTLAEPERVASLTLADTLAGIATDEIRQILHAEARAEPPPDPPVLGVHPAIDGLHERDLRQAFLYQQLSGFRDDAPTLEVVMLLLQTWHDIDTVASLDLPTLFVFGSEDQLFPPAALRKCAELIPGAEVVEIPGSAHSPYFEDAEAWNDAVGAFLTRHTFTS